MATLPTRRKRPCYSSIPQVVPLRRSWPSPTRHQSIKALEMPHLPYYFNLLLINQRPHPKTQFLALEAIMRPADVALTTLNTSTSAE